MPILERFAKPNFKHINTVRLLIVVQGLSNDYDRTELSMKMR